MGEILAKPQQQTPNPNQRRRWLLSILASSLLLLLLTSLLLLSASLFHPSASASLLSPRPAFVESLLLHPSFSSSSSSSSSAVPCLAYLVSGSRGEGLAIDRVLRAIYHPNNVYVVHLDLDAPPDERLRLSQSLRRDPVYSAVGNVRLIERSNLLTYRGPTMVANILHAAATLLSDGGDWDWFINLSASDYPLVTQDDILSVLAGIPRHLNFIEHTSDIGWKEYQRARPVLIDPGLYRSQKSDLFWITQKRTLPMAYRLFTGSSWMMLSHQFIEYCIWGWDNLPRIVLMYYANFLSSAEGYFHTVICNAGDFRETTVNHDLHYISWDNPPRKHPRHLNLNDFAKMVSSNAPFARKFLNEEPVLKQIDEELLHRHQPGGFSQGGWFTGDLNTSTGDLNTSNPQFKRVKVLSDLKPGPGAERLKILIDGLLSNKGPGMKHCV